MADENDLERKMNSGMDEPHEFDNNATGGLPSNTPNSNPEPIPNNENNNETK